MTVSEQQTDGLCLVSYVIELEDDRLVLSAVHARVIQQVRDDEAFLLGLHPPLSSAYLLHVPHSVKAVVLGVAGAACPLSTIPGCAALVEVCERLQLLAG